MSDPYWRQFMHTVTFEKDKPVEGVLEARNQEGPRDDPFPVLILRTPQNWKLKVNVTQVRLLSELQRQQPNVGDKVRIVYVGDATKAPPGMSPAKEFTVEVIRKDSQPPNSAKGTPGELLNEPRPGAGK